MYSQANLHACMCVLLCGCSRAPAHVRVCVQPWIAAAKPERFSTMSAVPFQQRSSINTMWRSINHPHVCDLRSCMVCACVCVCVSLRVLDACSTAGIQNCSLNYICTKTTGLCTRRAPLPASQHVSQQADAARCGAAPSVYFPPVFVCVSQFS